MVDEYNIAGESTAFLKDETDLAMFNGLYAASGRKFVRPLLFMVLAGFSLPDSGVPAADTDSAEEVSVPPGFTASLFADDALAHDVF